MPSFLKLPILRLLQPRIKRNTPLPPKLLRRDDVPQILRNQISRHKIKRITHIRPATPAHRARITTPVHKHRRLHLHPPKLPCIFHREVITRHLSPRLRDLQTMLRRHRHKPQLRPLSPQFVMLDLLASSFSHPVLFSRQKITRGLRRPRSLRAIYFRFAHLTQRSEPLRAIYFGPVPTSGTISPRHRTSHPDVILRKRRPSQSEGLPTKDLCIQLVRDAGSLVTDTASAPLSP